MNEPGDTGFFIFVRKTEGRLWDRGDRNLAPQPSFCLWNMLLRLFQSRKLAANRTALPDISKGELFYALFLTYFANEYRIQNVLTVLVRVIQMGGIYAPD
jgi:hypothetical protein